MLASGPATVPDDQPVASAPPAQPADAAQPEADPGDFITFWEFFSELFVPENRIEIPLKRAHRECCGVLHDAYLGHLPPEVQFIILNVAPRIGKTKLGEAWGAWGQAYFPDSQMIYTSYGAELAEASLAYVADTMRRPWYTDNFGDHLHAKRSDRLTTVEGGQIFASGTDGPLTGKGGGLKRPAGGFILIDDASKPTQALSPIEAKSKQEWFENTLKSRRNSDRFCPIVLIGQRLGPHDLPGYVWKNYREQCLMIKFPSLVDPATGLASNADDAISAFPETVSADTLKAYRKTRMGRFVLASQYQQEPIALGGNLIPTGAFHRWDPNTPMKFDKTVMTVDTAMKIKQANDFSAVALWGLSQKKAYLIDLMHGKWEAPDLLSNVKLLWERWTAAGIQERGIPRPRLIIEEKAAGTGLMQSLQRLGVPAQGIERDIDKVRRVQSILQYIETGMVVVPKDGSVPWLEKFVNECDEFQADGTQAHDDMVDTMVDAIEHLLGKPLSIFEVLTTRR